MPDKTTTVPSERSDSMQATPARKAITQGRRRDSVDFEQLKDKTRELVRARVKISVQEADHLGVVEVGKDLLMNKEQLGVSE
jgi:hypothetical protein